MEAKLSEVLGARLGEMLGPKLSETMCEKLVKFKEAKLSEDIAPELC